MADLQKIRLMGTTKELVDRLNSNFTELENRKVDEEFKTGSDKDYKVLSDNNFSDEEKAKLAQAVVEGDFNDALALKADTSYVDDELAKKVNITDIVDNLESTASNKPASANQVYILHGMITAINTLLQSDETDLDTLQEIVDFIKNNKSLIEGITTSKVNISDIIDSLDSQDPKKPLSANQGFVLNGLIEDINTALALLESDLETKVAKTDIVDNTSTYETDKVPSANAVSKMHDEIVSRIEDISYREYDFTADDEHWGSVAQNGVYELTFTPTAGEERPIAVYNADGYLVICSMGYVNNNVVVLSDEKFAGKLITQSVLSE